MRAIVLAVVVCLVLAGCHDNAIQLDASHWRCTNTVTTEVPMLIGKAIILMPETDCVQFTRKDQPR